MRVDGGQAFIDHPHPYRTQSRCETTGVVARDAGGLTLLAGQQAWQPHDDLDRRELVHERDDRVDVAVGLEVTGQGAHRVGEDPEASDAATPTRALPTSTPTRAPVRE